MYTHMINFKKKYWRYNLRGFFVHKGYALTDKEVRCVVNYCIDKGYETERELPDDEYLTAVSEGKGLIKEEKK